MPEEFEGDLAGAVFWGADLRGARFRDVDLTGARISHAWVVDVEIDALVDGIVINGVDVTAYVNERDPWYPPRSMLRASTPDEMRATWAALEAAWATTIVRAQALPGEALHDRSTASVLRPDAAASRLRDGQVVHGAGARRGFRPDRTPQQRSVDFPWPDLEYDLAPSASEALAVRADRAARFREYLTSVAMVDLAQPVEVLENGTNPLRECICTVFEEEFWHNRYALRDLADLEAARQPAVTASIPAQEQHARRRAAAGGDDGGPGAADLALAGVAAQLGHGLVEEAEAVRPALGELAAVRVDRQRRRRGRCAGRRRASPSPRRCRRSRAPRATRWR